MLHVNFSLKNLENCRRVLEKTSRLKINLQIREQNLQTHKENNFFTRTVTLTHATLLHHNARNKFGSRKKIRMKPEYFIQFKCALLQTTVFLQFVVHLLSLVAYCIRFCNSSGQ